MIIDDLFGINKEKMEPLITQPPIIDFHRVAMAYTPGEDVLKNIHFSLEKGSFHFITGDSGAGKTTLLNLLAIRQNPTQGRIQLFGKNLDTLSRGEKTKFRRRIGVVFQDFRLLDYLTTFDNIALPLRIAGYRGNVIRTRVAEMLKWVGLEKQAMAYPHQLSGGEAQRIAIARAVINKPDILLADEPTGSIDDDMARRILHLFVQLNKLGTTLLIATHNHHLISQIGAPQLHLKDGHLSLIKSSKVHHEI